MNVYFTHIKQLIFVSHPRPMPFRSNKTDRKTSLLAMYISFLKWAVHKEIISAFRTQPPASKIYYWLCFFNQEQYEQSFNVVKLFFLANVYSNMSGKWGCFKNIAYLTIPIRLNSHVVDLLLILPADLHR